MRHAEDAKRETDYEKWLDRHALTIRGVELSDGRKLLRRIIEAASIDGLDLLMETDFITGLKGEENEHRTD